MDDQYKAYLDILSHEGSISMQMQGTVSETGLAFGGYEQRIKTWGSTVDNMQRNGRTVPEMHDIIRYTVLCHEDNYGSDIKDQINAMRSVGLELVNFKNYWAAPKDGLNCNPYNGINTTWKAEGISFEVQFHTPDSYHVKEDVMHPIYKIFRDLSDDDPQKSVLSSKMLAIALEQKVPDGAVDIKPRDFLGEKDSVTAEGSSSKVDSNGQPDGLTKDEAQQVEGSVQENIEGVKGRSVFKEETMKNNEMEKQTGKKDKTDTGTSQNEQDDVEKKKNKAESDWHDPIE